MENKKKSYFNELGFKATIGKLVNHVAKLYLEDQNPWQLVIQVVKIVAPAYN